MLDPITEYFLQASACFACGCDFAAHARYVYAMCAEYNCLWLTLLCCVLLCSLIILALPSLEDANVKVVEFSCERRFLITEKCK